MRGDDGGCAVRCGVIYNIMIISHMALRIVCCHVWYVVCDAVYDGVRDVVRDIV